MFGAPLHMAILLGKRSIVEVLVKNGGEAANCTCGQYLFSLVNHFLDMLIGRDTGLNAVDIAVEMRMEEIYDILARNGLRGVRWGRTMTCIWLMNSSLPSPCSK